MDPPRETGYTTNRPWKGRQPRYYALGHVEKAACGYPIPSSAWSG